MVNKKLTDKVIAFAAGNESTMKLINQFIDYWNHSNKKGEYDVTFSLAEKEDKLNAALKKEILWRANVPYAAETPVEQWFSKKSIVEETFAVVGMLVDVILPESIINSIGLYTDVRVIGWGDSASFDIEPRDLFVVSKAGRAQRTSEIKKQFRGQVTVVPFMHEMTVGVSLFRVLAGKESLATFVMKAVRSMEAAVSVDCYNAFATAMAAVDSTTTTGLLISGYSQSGVIRLCEQVSSWNMGAKPLIVGTAVALLNLLPDDANYRYDLESDYVKLGFIPTMAGYDVLRLPQVAKIGTPFDRVISDSYIWIVSPSANKLLKLVLEGNMLTNQTGIYENADLTQTTTLWKSWNVAVASNAVAGVLTI